MSSTSTDSTSDTADKGSTYHILKYDDKDVPIIEGLKDEILKSDDELKNIPIQDLFPIGSIWDRKSILKDNLSEYATRHNFTVFCNAGYKIILSKSLDIRLPLGPALSHHSIQRQSHSRVQAREIAYF